MQKPFPGFQKESLMFRKTEVLNKGLTIIEILISGAIGLLLLLYVLPYLFGFYYTKLGVVINIIWYDVIFYTFAKIRDKMEDK